MEDEIKTSFSDQAINAINQLAESQEWKNFKEALVNLARAVWERLREAFIRISQVIKKAIALNKALRENPKLVSLAHSKKKRVAKKNIKRLWKIAERGSRA
jgi:poly-D-alanine transfer protein DltD